MWRRSVAASARALRVNARKNPQQQQQQRFLSAASLSPEELELLNEPREAMDYDVVLVRVLSISLQRDEEAEDQVRERESSQCIGISW